MVTKKELPLSGLLKSYALWFLFDIHICMKYKASFVTLIALHETLMNYATEYFLRHISYNFEFLVTKRIDLARRPNKSSPPSRINHDNLEWYWNAVSQNNINNDTKEKGSKTQP